MATPQTVRYLNKRRALTVLFRQGALTRAALARHLGLNRSSIGYIVDELLRDGLVREREVVTANEVGDRQLGRPGILVEIAPGGAVFIGVEIGVDSITIIAIDLVARQILSETTEHACIDHEPAATIARVAGLLSDIIGSFRDTSARIEGICIAVPALVRDGMVCNGLMIGWRDVALRRELRRALTIEVPVVVENDASAFAIGETYRGASARADTVAFLVIENGAGGGIVIGGHLFRGAGGFAGEFGQMLVFGIGADGRIETDHLENRIGKKAVLTAYRAAGRAERATFDTFLEQLRAGDSAAVRVADEWADWLARGLVNVVNVLNPGLIILGGSVAPIYEDVETRVKALMRRELLDGFPVPAIEVSAATRGGAALGAACLLHQKMFTFDEDWFAVAAEPAETRRDGVVETFRRRRARGSER